jgi:hypothetical protein
LSATARSCPVSERVRFSAAHPAESDNGPVVNLVEQADYDDQRARLAGIQRLLVIASYDASPIDGMEGARTLSATKAFLRDRKLRADAAARPDFFATLHEAARKPEGTAFTGVTRPNIRSWPRSGSSKWAPSSPAAGTRSRPDNACGRPCASSRSRSIPNAEAVDDKGQPVIRSGAPLSWGRTVTLCTRDGKFELAEHKDCATCGLNPAGFATIEVGGSQPATQHFRDF